MLIVPSWREEARRDSDRRRALLVAVLGVLVAEAPDERSECIFRRCLDWSVHKQTLLLEGQFKRCYRMDDQSFERLLMMIRPALARDELQSMRRTGTDPVTPENMLQMTISWLAGSSYHTTRGKGGTSVSGFYDYLHAVIDAICGCPVLHIRSPVESEEGMLELADDSHLSARTEFSQDVWAVLTDGCVISVLQSRKKYRTLLHSSPGTTRSYCFNSPGKIGDFIAFKKWKLSKDIMNMPAGFYIVGDNAYPLSDSLLVPFTKLEIKHKKHSDFNFSEPATN